MLHSRSPLANHSISYSAHTPIPHLQSIPPPNTTPFGNRRFFKVCESVPVLNICFDLNKNDTTYILSHSDGCASLALPVDGLSMWKTDSQFCMMTTQADGIKTLELGATKKKTGMTVTEYCGEGGQCWKQAKY